MFTEAIEVVCVDSSNVFCLTSAIKIQLLYRTSCEKLTIHTKCLNKTNMNVYLMYKGES